ncbi:MAG: 16S rRNA (guanine(527)-N(7))-methyltransferase RsmG [Terracidiphilus sp.]|jgi:16S rRNA (guanine527-N7)-methyltransferase
MTAEMSQDPTSVAERLNALLAKASLVPLDPALGQRFEDYLGLLMRWNARINLTAIRDEEGILTRHFIESIACALALPQGIRTLLDFGSGAGFPGVPIALCRPEIAVTLAESQGKKAAFLQEAIRVLDLRAEVFGGRAELMKDSFDCVTLRAVDRMEHAAGVAAQLVGSGGWLVLMTTSAELRSLQTAAGAAFSWQGEVLLPGSADRVLAIGEEATHPASA